MTISKADKTELLEVANMYREMTKITHSLREINGISAFLEVCIFWINSPLHYVFIAKDKGKPIGLLTLFIDDNNGLNSPCLNVTGTYIKDEYRRSNAIKLLMNTALKVANNLKINLHTYATPKSASLSLKMGGVVRTIEIERVFNG